MEEVLISIIVPVYNAKKTLKRCCISLINQTYKNIEILLINDGSKDNSLEICYRFKNKDKRIKVINKENGGVSSARNAGIKNAKGDYICFVDSDDYVNKNYILHMYNAIIKYKADVCFAGYFIKQKDLEQKMQDTLQEEYFEKEEYYKKMLDYKYGKYAMHFPVAKLLKAEIIKMYRIFFNENISCGEDMLFNAIYYQKCKSMVTIPDCDYYYIVQEKSLSNKFDPNFCRNMKQVYIEYRKIFSGISSIKQNQIDELLVVLLRNAMFNFYTEKRTLREGIRKLKKCYKELEIERIIKEKKVGNKSNQLIIFFIKYRLYGILCFLFASKKPIKEKAFPLFCYIRKII